jgi:predicted ATP-dependent serine protease
MVKCLSCGSTNSKLALNCPECGSFYSAIVEDFSSKNNASFDSVITNEKVESSNTKQVEKSLVQRFLQLFR